MSNRHSEELKAANAAISSQQNTISELQEEVQRLGHSEQGIVDCGDLSAWHDGHYSLPYAIHTYKSSRSLRVNFKTAYTKPPLVQLSIVGLHKNQVHHEYYAAAVEQVDTEGFTMRCLSYEGGSYHIIDMDVSWISAARI